MPFVSKHAQQTKNLAQMHLIVQIEGCFYLYGLKLTQKMNWLLIASSWGLNFTQKCWFTTQNVVQDYLKVGEKTQITPACPELLETGPDLLNQLTSC